ncbi:aminotransferase class V-fold PLP-dependent enzyme [Wenzhouxiangella sp. AB-CW3]|uniref:aminotransferase class V-fold PLP-dependent enzyme n=1 Tax=Wenzhouxiangella sp. AB-CW3 TaxID=2771012 RepID=UPI00168AC1D1|nr:aminotransferase class V-fold PLP-dependent enzyme [Wenzhouxiangella sp. AB-CW3]QOC22247.1 aminotransferase class V-fold PLP-dependent enzyme [Wenzhouxiangella sp. AB-CW3]
MASAVDRYAPPRLGSRELFPELETRVYANHASLSPPSQPVVNAVSACLSQYARDGMGSYANETERRERLRGRLAHLIGAPTRDLALVGNTTAGVLAVALGIPWRRGDRILVFDGEFPTNITPWQQAARREGLELVWMRADDFRTDHAGWLQQMEDHLRAGIRLVAVSAVQFTTGQRMPLETMGAMCRQHGAELFVDAIQAMGVVPLDVEACAIDYLTCGSHKWLMGPEGTGCFYARAEAAARLEPNVAGWLSHADPFAFLTRAPNELRYDRPLVQSARMVEFGTPHTLAAAGLEASVGLIDAIGVESIFEHVQAWHDALEPGLLDRGFSSARMVENEGRSGILSVCTTDAAAGPAWSRALAEYGIESASPDGWLRLSPHWPNGLDEADILLAAIDEIRAGGGP